MSDIHVPDAPSFFNVRSLRSRLREAIDIAKSGAPVFIGVDGYAEVVTMTAASGPVSAGSVSGPILVMTATPQGLAVLTGGRVSLPVVYVDGGHTVFMRGTREKPCDRVEFVLWLRALADVIDRLPESEGV